MIKCVGYFLKLILLLPEHLQSLYLKNFWGHNLSTANFTCIQILKTSSFWVEEKAQVSVCFHEIPPKALKKRLAYVSRQYDVWKIQVITIIHIYQKSLGKKYLLSFITRSTPFSLIEQNSGYGRLFIMQSTQRLCKFIFIEIQVENKL